jgi:hypothetical protein
MPSRLVKSLGRTLDARPDRLDLRDRPYAPPVATLPPSFPDDGSMRTWLPAYATSGLVLDQGSQGACTGFGLACVIHYLLFRRRLDTGGRRALVPVSARMLYHLARFYDEWPGEDYDGSSCRGALKGWHRHGVCADALWPYRDRRGRVRFVSPRPGWDADAVQRRLGVYYRVNRESVVDMQAAIREIGAIYVSADAHDGWDLEAVRGPVTGHASLPVIGSMRDPDSLGGHAFALIGYNPTGFVVQNSWGRDWGRQGFAVLPYDEWVRNGSDAWACALGVPAAEGLSSRVITPSAAPRPAPARGGVRAPAGRARVAVSAAVQPWTVADAYQHTVVLGNEGRSVNRLVTSESGAASVAEVVVSLPTRWFAAARPAVPRLLLYAHGGLNSEDESVRRIQVLAPYFKANGVYPLFVTWKTGVLETLVNILEDRLAGPERAAAFAFPGFGDRARDVLDRTIEVAARPVAGPLWSQMKQNAAAAAEDGRGIALVGRALEELSRATSRLEIHLVGHSAGAILLGHLLDVARRRALAIRSCSLYAPACTLQFTLERYGPAVAQGVLAKPDLHLHLLSDRREREDAVGPYGKSLLYLVSRALEAAHKTPLLGLAEAFNPASNALDLWNAGERATVREFQAWWGGARNVHVVSAPQVSTGTSGRTIASAHGAFDNDADTITRTLTRVLGAPPVHAIESLEF